MANHNATIAAASAAVPPEKTRVNQNHGRIRFFESTYDAAESGAPASGDTITWGELPVGARVIGHLSELSYGAGTADSTATVGDADDADRYLAAQAITSAGSASLTSGAGGAASYVVTEETKTVTSTIAGAAVGAAQKIALRLAYVLD